MGWFDGKAGGLLGNFGGNNQGMGILGGQNIQPSGMDIASLISATLSDGYAGYRGKQGTAVDSAVQGMQSHGVRQQLMAGLQSTDPSIRQKAYMFANVNGIPTDGFQKQQAQTQLPAFLNSMKPSTQTLNSQSAPLPSGGNITTAPINFEAPGQSFSDAVMSAPPELQAQYAPKLLDKQMEQQFSAVTPATAEQKIAAGLDPRTPAQIDSNGKISPITDPNQITAYQTRELANSAAGRSTQAAQLAETVRHNKAMEGPSIGAAVGAQPLTAYPPQTQSMVKAMLEGRQAPPTSFAMSKPYWQNLIAIANEADPTFDQTQWGARVSARKDMLGGGQSYKTLNAGNTAIQHLGRLHSQIGDVAGHQVPLIGNFLNSAENAATKASGVPGVPAYNDTLGHLAEETTKFYRGTGGSEEDVRRNMSNLGADLSSQQKESGTANTVHLIYGKLAPMVEQYNKTMGTNYPTSHFLSKEAASTIKKMGFDPDSGEAVQKPANTPSTASLPRVPVKVATDADYAKLPSGSLFIGPDGHQRKKP